MAVDSNIQALLEKAKSGDAGAQCDLGMVFEEGCGVAKDEKAACEWYQQAAEQGHARAQLNLGVMYEEGRGVAKDKKVAFEWYWLAAGQGHALAQLFLGEMLEEGCGVAKDEKAACEWYECAAEQGNSEAQFHLGAMYEEGRGISKDKKAAFEWYQQAAVQGYAKAQYALGWMLAKGIGVTKDEKAACDWFQIAAVQGNQGAKKFLEELANRSSNIAKDALVILSATEIVNSTITLALYAIKTKDSIVENIVRLTINENTNLQDMITALLWTAYYNNNVNVFEYILKVVKNALMKQDRDKDVHSIQDKHGNTALALAVKGGHVETVRWLLTQGAYYNMQNNKGEIAISLLSPNSPPDIRILLLNAENLIEIAEVMRIRNFLISTAATVENIEEVLSELGFCINARRIQDGNSALHLAIIEHPSLVEELLECDANLELLNHDKISPFELAKKLYSEENTDENLYVFVLCLFKKLKNLAAIRSNLLSSQETLEFENKSLSEAAHVDKPFENLCERMLSIIDKLNEPKKSEICYQMGSWFSKYECLVPVFAYKILMKVEKQSSHYETAHELIRNLIMSGHIIFQKQSAHQNSRGLSLDEEVFEETLVPVFCDGINVPTDIETRKIRYQSILKHHILAGNKKDKAVGRLLVSYVLGEEHSVSGIDGIEGTDPDSLLNLFNIVSKRDSKFFSIHAEKPLNKKIQSVSSQQTVPKGADQQGIESGVERKEQKEHKDRGDFKMHVESTSNSSSSAKEVSYQFKSGKRKNTDSDIIPARNDSKRKRR